MDVLRNDPMGRLDISMDDSSHRQNFDLFNLLP